MLAGRVLEGGTTIRKYGHEITADSTLKLTCVQSSERGKYSMQSWQADRSDHLQHFLSNGGSRDARSGQ